MKKLDKVYIVIGHEGPMYGDNSWVQKVFKSKEQAEKYCDLQNELDDMHGYYVSEMEVEELDLSTRIENYYSYSISKEILSFKQIPMYELKVYLKSYLTVEQYEKFEEKEKSDTDVNKYGARTYKKVFTYLKKVLSEEVIKEIEESYNNPLNNDFNDEETVKRIYDKDLVIDETEDYIEVFSIESFEKAKMEALKLYESFKSN